MATEYTCFFEEPIWDTEFMDHNGEIVAVLRATDCFSRWLVENYLEQGLYPAAECLTWRHREVQVPQPGDPDLPEEPPEPNPKPEEPTEPADSEPV